jgi:beta-glucosidase
VSAAKTANVVIMVVGEPPEAEQAGDINDLTLYAAQQELYTKIANQTVWLDMMVAGRHKEVYNSTDVVRDELL